MPMKMTVSGWGTLALLGLAFQLGAAVGFDANPVPAIGQNAADVKGDANSSRPRVLIIGNSITRHGPRPEIGWTNNFGMAATSIEKDFAHLLAKNVKSMHPYASFALANVAATFERRFQSGIDLERDFGWMRDWKPDAVVLFFGANVPHEYERAPDGRFGQELEKLRNYLADGKRTKFLFVEGFYSRPVLDGEKRALARKYGDVWVPLADIRARNDVRGRFNHPNDNGMRLIADRIWDRLEQPIAMIGPIFAYGKGVANYDETKIGEYTLEDPLVFADGTPLKSPADWPRRRREIVDLFAREMYGREPPRPEALAWEVVGERVVMGGYVRLRQVRMWFKPGKAGPSLDWFLFLPRFAKEPVPPIVMLNYRGASEYLYDSEVPLVTSWGLSDTRKFNERRGCLCDPDNRSHCPIQVIMAKGYALVTACYTDVAPDPGQWAETSKPPKGRPATYPYCGLFELWGERDEAQTDNITSLGAWAWALSRGLDLVEKMEDVDATRAVVTGCSRLGKAAVLAAVRDERFKVCVPNQCGGGGVTLAKRNYGECLRTEFSSFHNWYCKAYWKYLGREREMPFDQHLLIAAVAPRAIFIQGHDDGWYDTYGEYLACKAASPVWAFLGKEGLRSADAFPDDFDTACVGGDLSYVHRCRHHGLAAQDWVWLLDFVDHQFEKGK